MFAPLHLPLIVRICAVWALVQGSAMASTCPAHVQVAYTESTLPPYVLGKGSELQHPPGLFVEWTRRAFDRLGCRSSLSEVRLPYNRIVASMAEGTVDIRVTGAYRDEIADAMVFPTAGSAINRAMAVAEAPTTLYVRKQMPLLTWDGEELQFLAKGSAIGTVRGHYTEKLIQARNWPTDSAATWEDNVKKLLVGRVAAIVGPDSVVESSPEIGKMTKLAPPVAVDLYFAPVSRHFFERYPEFTQRFWLEICRESRATFHTLPACH